jgi:hypothetical protein
MNLIDIDILFEEVRSEQHIIDEFNRRLHSLDEKKRKLCTIHPTDSRKKIRKKCKVAKVWGLHYAPVWDRYVNSPSDTATPEGGVSDVGDVGDAGVTEIQGSGLVYPNSIGPEMDDEFTNEQLVSQEPNLKQLMYTVPSVEQEWPEAERYSSLKKGGIDKWNQLIQKGNIVKWSELDNVRNHDPDLEQLDPQKVLNVSTLIKAGVVELPIVGIWPDGDYELIAGNTRTAVLTRLGYDPYVIVIKFPSSRKKTDFTSPRKKTPPKQKPTTKKPPSKKKKPTPKKEPSKEKPKSSTERVRRYYKRHPEKVRKHLRDTQDDRVKRNGDRAKAVKKYGKKKMKNHDVHHPKGVDGGTWRLAKKDHGPDKKNESTEYRYLSEIMEGNTPAGSWVLISEGGAAGHLAHPYEDNDLRFFDVKKMVKRGLVGGLDAEAEVTEKLDGQNIMFTVKDGRVYFARNKGQVKNKGQNALDVAGIRQMFAGRGNIEKAFSGAAQDIQSAVDALPPETQQNMFSGGSNFMNVEIIFPDTKNVIPYDKNVLVFHGTVAYNEAGEEVGRNIDDGKTLSDELIKVNADQQATFGLSGPRSIVFNDADTSKNMKKMREYIGTVTRLQKQYGLDDKATIADYKKEWWSTELDKMGIDWTASERRGLINRWALGDKTFGVKDIKDPEKKKLFREFEANQLLKFQKAATRPLERVFLRLGADTLKRITNLLSANNPDLAFNLKQEVLDSIKSIQETGDENKLAKLQVEIERLEDIGLNNIVPSEGIVFIYNGKPYKFTGLFAPVNQILGTLKFQKGKAEAQDVEQAEEPAVEPQETQPEEPPAQPTEEPAADTTQAEPEEPQEKRTIAVFTGRFQPFHAGHYSMYQNMVNKFGKENVYVATSNKTDSIKSPFAFSDKKEIMMKMFKIPERMIVQVKNPYAPAEILDKLPDNTVYVTAVSQKDAGRLSGGKYFKSYEDTPEENQQGYKEAGYVLVLPEMQLQVDGKNISGTQLRHVFGSSKYTDAAKKQIFTKVYGQFDSKVFNKIVKTTSQAEEARELTANFGANAEPEQPAPTTQPQGEPKTGQQQPQELPAAQQVQEPAATGNEPQQLPAADTGASRVPYAPGQTWTTDSGLFGAKNRKNVVRYYTNIDSATKFAGR